MKPKTVYVVQFMGRTEWIEDYSVHPCRTKVIAIAAAAEKAKAHPSYKMISRGAVCIIQN